MAERKKYEDGWTETEKVPGEHGTPVLVGTDPIERGMYNVGVTYNQIKKVVGNISDEEPIAPQPQWIIQSLENIDFDALIGDGSQPADSEFETGLTAEQKEALWENPSQVVIKVWVNAEAAGNYDQVFLTKNNQYIATSAEEGGEPTVERCCKFDAHFISTEDGFNVSGFEIGIYVEGQPDGQSDGFIRYYTTKVGAGE